MKTKTYLIIVLLFLSLNIGACSGYKPIYSSSGLEFKIEDFSILGDKQLSNQIYSKLYAISKNNKNSTEDKSIYVSINAAATRDVTSKDSAGKILGYRINLITTIEVKNFKSGDEVLKESIHFSSTYQVQDQLFETKNLENKSIENLIDKTYQNILIKLSDKLQ